VTTPFLPESRSLAWAAYRGIPSSKFSGTDMRTMLESNSGALSFTSSIPMFTWNETFSASLRDVYDDTDNKNKNNNNNNQGTGQDYSSLFFIVAPCIFVTSKFFSPTKAAFY
jgi:hypothetical protein